MLREDGVVSAQVEARSALQEGRERAGVSSAAGVLGVTAAAVAATAAALTGDEAFALVRCFTAVSVTSYSDDTGVSGFHALHSTAAGTALVSAFAWR